MRIQVLFDFKSEPKRVSEKQIEGHQGTEPECRASGRSYMQKFQHQNTIAMRIKISRWSRMRCELQETTNRLTVCGSTTMYQKREPAAQILADAEAAHSLSSYGGVGHLP